MRRVILAATTPRPFTGWFSAAIYIEVDCYDAAMREISRNETILLWALTCVVFAATIVHFKNYADEVDNSGDSSAYMQAASCIQHADVRDSRVKQFWGVSYLTAAVSLFSRFSERTSLLVVCGISSLLSVLLAHQLWGGWIASYFAIINFEWLQRSYLGGAEPLFMALLLASFLAIRQERWILAALLAALATVTRPVGIFALVALAIPLLWKRQFKTLLLCTSLSLVIGMLYLLPFWIYLGDPFFQLHSYKTHDWQSGMPIGMPFRAIAMSMAHNREPWTNLILTGGWIVFMLVGLLAMCRKDFRAYFHEYRAEGIFAFLYIAFLFTYNSQAWARADIVRFAIPALPFVLLSLRDWIPRQRVVVYSLGILCAGLAAFSAIGIRNVFPALR